MIFGSAGSRSSFLRSRLTCVSTLRSSAFAVRPRARSRSWSRLKHPLRPLHQRDQEIVFAGAERHRHAVVAKQFARAGVESPAIEPVALGAGLRTRGRHRFLRAPQDRLDARDQLAAAERLRQIIVGAHFEADDAVDLVALGGEHDDRNVRFRTQRAAERQPVLAGQHQIEQDQIDAAVGQDLAHGFAVGGRADAEAILRERTRYQFADLAMVIDDEDVRRARHGGIIEQARPGRFP